MKVGSRLGALGKVNKSKYIFMVRIKKYFLFTLVAFWSSFLLTLLPSHRTGGEIPPREAILAIRENLFAVKSWRTFYGLGNLFRRPSIPRQTNLLGGARCGCVRLQNNFLKLFTQITPFLTQVRVHAAYRSSPLAVCFYRVGVRLFLQSSGSFLSLGFMYFLGKAQIELFPNVLVYVLAKVRRALSIERERVNK